jgi:putative membrane protein
MLIAKRVPLRYIFGQIRWELVATFVLATFVSVGDNYIDKDLPPFVLPYFLSVVSVIIVFRTSQAYARWWEARRAWGNIVNDMRTLARQLLFFHSPQSADKILESYRARSIQRLIAFPYLLAHQLRHQDLQPTREKYLSAEEAQKVVACDNQAAGVLALQAMATQQAFSERLMTPQQQTQIDDSLTRLTDSMGLCERIKNAIFPGIYSQFYYFLLFLFVLLLPLSIFDDLGFVEIPATLAIATIFFLLEKTAVSMQNPFENQPTDVEMSNLSKRIEIDFRQMAGEKDVPPIPPPDDFYIL